MAQQTRAILSRERRRTPAGRAWSQRFVMAGALFVWRGLEILTQECRGRHPSGGVLSFETSLQQERPILRPCNKSTFYPGMAKTGKNLQQGNNSVTSHRAFPQRPLEYCVSSLFISSFHVSSFTGRSHTLWTMYVRTKFGGNKYETAGKGYCHWGDTTSKSDPTGRRQYATEVKGITTITTHRSCGIG